MTMIRKFVPVLAGALACVLIFTATAFAASGVAPASEPIGDYLALVYAAFARGHYAEAGAIAAVLATALARRYGSSYVPFLATRQGTAALLVVGSFATALAARLAGGVDLTLEMARDSLRIAFYAAGGFFALKELIVEPLLVRLVDKYPRAAAPLRLLVAIFASPPKAPPAPVLP